MAISVSDLLKKLDAVPMSVIEDIKAEIKTLAQEYDFYADTRRKNGLWTALEIIDKHCGKENTDERKTKGEVLEKDV